ncbi:MAG: hypothetical protein Q9219_001707 [cf. Caloplaca sp. 3 TL-2023]
MGFLKEEANESALEYCHFPTSSLPRASDHHLRYGATFNIKELASRWGDDRQALAQTAQAAWAILLRYYIRNNIVAFAAFSGPSKDKPKCVTNGVNGRREEGFRLLRYEISDGSSFNQIRSAGSETRQVSIRHGSRLNTAIVYSNTCLDNNAQEAEQRGSDDVYSPFDLMLELNTSIPCVAVIHRYPNVSQSYAQAIAQSFQRIIGCLTRDCELTIGEVDFLTEYDRSHMLSWNPKDVFSAERRACLHHLVETKTQEHPNSPAICAWDGDLTYSELNTLADTAAERLVALGVGPGILVPFAYEKSLWAVVAMLAILKAGGAFVPINPLDPPVRLAEILSSLRADVIVTMKSLAPVFQSMVKHVEIITAEAIPLARAGVQSNGMLRPTKGSVSPSDPVFVLFTSGSTGKPKGMIHEHAAICTHALTHGEAMGYHQARMLQFAAYTFDVAIIDVFTTLLFGGCICIPSEEDRRSDVTHVINAMRADYAILTPSFAGLINPVKVPTLRIIAVGGEALPPERIERWAEKVRLIQIYGPAEVGICATIDMKLTTRPETIGYPLINSSCWLVDPDDTDILVPIGAVGELIVGGPSLARGYLNDKARTNSSFIRKPAWATRLGLPLDRFYKTGDLLKYNIDSFDGSFDFVGRSDNQIKLRGQRIEPGEVEFYLARLPGVAISMVTRPAKGYFAGEMVAVVQMGGEECRVRNEAINLAPDQSLSVGLLRNQLSKSLPSYMIPSVCLVVNSMPFVPSLKINRRAVTDWLMSLGARPPELSLPNLSELGPDEATAYALSSNIADLVAKNGDRRHCSLEGSDFSLYGVGMNSIQIIALSMLLRQQYTTKIPLNMLLSPEVTVRGLAKLVDSSNDRIVGNSPAVLESSSMGFQPLDIQGEINTLTACLFREIEGYQIPTKRRDPHNPVRNVLITGATGFLGIAILHHLLDVPTIQIRVLIRRSNEVEGLARLKEAAITSGWWRDTYNSRIQVWYGDLAQPSLGLDASNIELLLGIAPGRENAFIDTIIHSGARVHYSSAYQSLKAVNVLSTIELIKFMIKSTCLRSFVFVSGGEKPSMEHDLSSLSTSANGYTQSKYVAESIVRNYAMCPIFNEMVANNDVDCYSQSKSATRQNGISQQQGFHNSSPYFHTIKPGYIIGSPTDYSAVDRTTAARDMTARSRGTHCIANRQDFIWRLVAGCIEIRAVNRDELNHWLFIADTDTVAQKVTDCLFMPATTDVSDGHSMNRILTGLRFSTLWTVVEDVLASEGHPSVKLERLGYEDWMARLKGMVLEKGERHLLFPLLETLELEGSCIGDEGYESRKEESAIKEAVKKNLESLINVGFFTGY